MPFVIVGIALAIIALLLAGRGTSSGEGNVVRRWWADTFHPKPGSGGEAYVRGLLARLGPEYIVMNDVTIPNGPSTTQFDHLVFSPYGVFVIETKDYSGRVYGSEHAEQWTQYIGDETYKFYNPVRQNEGHVRALQKKLGYQFFVPIVVFVGDAELKIRRDKAIVLDGYQLVPTITSYREVRMSQDDAQHLANLVISFAAVLSEEDKEAHAANVRRMVYNRQADMMMGRCPRCGGKLVRRQSSYGPFFGCSNYPKCKFTSDISS